MQRILFAAILLVSLLICFIAPVSAGVLDDYKAAAAAFKGQQYDEAIRLFTKVIDSGELSQEDLSRAYNSRGLAWAQKRDFDKAIADFTKVIEIDPRDDIAYYNRGFIWVQKKDYVMAIADFTKVIEIDPNLAIAYYSRGLAWKEKGNNEKADADYKKAIELDPELRNLPKY